ncbi:hypothetical protein [Methylotenera sp.]|uniref:hypothetical protein n=1 Tax=Methylotenera sp. TaxID=2051956 RepID=UPI0027315936|nr:hypothetical protein [Methylotenera sp.]MDP2071554.1 hypothetical protein [Methylotenera sp.]MDP2152985.1 hypothetical protein [Methylotenera sp.]MDP3004923.1 hypothetical protein [Methylotenera sp.]MDP3307105.1 hypothetical protein [Methylotenera sp.]
MANATPQQNYNIQLSRLQLELLAKLIDEGLYAHESGFPHKNPKLLKRTCDVFWEHLKPSPEEKLMRMQSWIDQIYVKRIADVNLVKAA